MAQDHYNGVHARITHHHIHNHSHAKMQQSGFEGAPQGCRYGIKSSSSLEMNSPVPYERKGKSGQRGHKQGGRKQWNWDTSGPGMQAIFLGPNRKSCGTGVFIPRGHGIAPQLTNKPAFSPVLLPSRVIQALNLNVHELGQHIKPLSADEKKKEDYISLSPEILLPEEWTY